MLPDDLLIFMMLKILWIDIFLKQRVLDMMNFGPTNVLISKIRYIVYICVCLSVVKITSVCLTKRRNFNRNKNKFIKIFDKNYILLCTYILIIE